jgi:pimeloyl-ACP methyl ester carboxylesterase
MKTKISIFAFALFALVLNINAQNNYKWIHGLNGTEDSWKIYKEAFTPVNGSILKYSSDKSITGIAEVVWNANYNQFNQNTILIGHSMGGLVARELERNHSAKIKGIITLGTPHQGAHVAKELRFGGLNKLKDKVVLKGNDCVIASSLAFAYDIPGLTPFFLSIALSVNTVSAVLTGPIGDIALNEIAANEFNKGCTDDLQPGSPFLNTLASRKINVPILTFASQEDRWQLPRVVHCQSNYKRLSTDPYANVDGNFDMTGYNALSDFNNGLKVFADIHNRFAEVCDVIGYVFPSNLVAAALHRTAASKLISASNYIENGLDYDHAVLIGATRVDPIPQYHESLSLRQLDLSQPGIKEDGYVTYTYVTVPEPHDGVVPVKSQQLDKSRGYNVIWANTTIKGVNHMEQRNHPNTKREFDAVLDGRSYRPDVFDKKR